jgi:hypothetical protein
VSQIPHAVDTVVCAPDDGWGYHPKHVEQFPDKINCVTLHLVGYTPILEYSYDARTHEVTFIFTLSLACSWMYSRLLNMSLERCSNNFLFRTILLCAI